MISSSSSSSSSASALSRFSAVSGTSGLYGLISFVRTVDRNLKNRAPPMCAQKKWQLSACSVVSSQPHGNVVQVHTDVRGCLYTATINVRRTIGTAAMILNANILDKDHGLVLALDRALALALALDRALARHLLAAASTTTRASFGPHSRATERTSRASKRLPLHSKRAGNKGQKVLNQEKTHNQRKKCDEFRSVQGGSTHC